MLLSPSDHIDREFQIRREYLVRIATGIPVIVGLPIVLGLLWPGSLLAKLALVAFGLLAAAFVAVPAITTVVWLAIDDQGLRFRHVIGEKRSYSWHEIRNIMRIPRTPLRHEDELRLILADGSSVRLTARLGDLGAIASALGARWSPVSSDSAVPTRGARWPALVLGTTGTALVIGAVVTAPGQPEALLIVAGLVMFVAAGVSVFSRRP